MFSRFIESIKTIDKKKLNPIIYFYLSPKIIEQSLSIYRCSKRIIQSLYQPNFYILEDSIIGLWLSCNSGNNNHVNITYMIFENKANSLADFHHSQYNLPGRKMY